MTTEPSTAVLFPGMGATGFDQVGRFMVLDRHARERVRAADEALDCSLLSAFRNEGSGYGVYSQVAFMVNSVALADRAEDRFGMRPAFCVGPSFGHRALTAYCGALDFASAVRLTADLARCEHDYFTRDADGVDDPVTHTFVRVPEEPMRELVAGLTDRGEWVEISGHLDRGHFLVSLPGRLLDEMIDAVRALGGYSLQTMRPPVHARRFGALRRLVARDVLPKYDLADPVLPVLADQDGRLVRTADELRTLLLDHFDRPIDWPVTAAALAGQGVGTVYITGPDQQFHRMTATTERFRVVPVSPVTASRPAKS